MTSSAEGVEAYVRQGIKNADLGGDDLGGDRCDIEETKTGVVWWKREEVEGRERARRAPLARAEEIVRLINIMIYSE